MKRATRWALVMIIPALSALAAEDGVEERFEALLRQEETSASDFVAFAEEAFEEGDLATAGRAYDKALQLEPTNLTALRNRAILAAHYGDWNAALGLVERATAAHKDYRDGYWERVYVLCRMRKLTEAGSALDEARKADAPAGLVAGVAGQLAFLRGDYGKAAEEWRAASKMIEARPEFSLQSIELSSVATEAKEGLGYALFAQGKYEECAQHFLVLQQEQRTIEHRYLLWLYASTLKIKGRAGACAAINEAMEDKRDMGRRGPASEVLAVLLREADDDKVAEFLREQREAHAAWGGEVAYVAGKWAQFAGRKKLSESYFREAAVHIQGDFFTAILAERELVPQEQGTEAPAEGAQ